MLDRNHLSSPALDRPIVIIPAASLNGARARLAVVVQPTNLRALAVRAMDGAR